MIDYTSVHSVSRKFGEANDCAVVAVSIATETPYEIVHEMFHEAGRKNGQGTYRYQTGNVIEKLGFEITEYRMPVNPYSNYEQPGTLAYGKKLFNQIVAEYPKYYRPNSLTVKQITTFPEAWKRNISTGLVFVNRHVLTYKDGKVHDWSEGRKKRIHTIWAIQRKANPMAGDGTRLENERA